MGQMFGMTQKERINQNQVVQDLVFIIINVNISLLKQNSWLRDPTVKQTAAPQLTDCTMLLHKHNFMLHSDDL